METRVSPDVSESITTRERTVVRGVRPSYQAYQILHFGFTVAPIIAGLDKFFHLLVNWNMYLAPMVYQPFGISADNCMMIVGAIEIAVGLLVAWRPRVFGWVVGFWLWGIIANL